VIASLSRRSTYNRWLQSPGSLDSPAAKQNAFTIRAHFGAALLLTFALSGTQATVLAQPLVSPQTRVHERDPSELAQTSSTWRGAVADSLRLLMIEHSSRIAFQSKTRREHGGRESCHARSTAVVIRLQSARLAWSDESSTGAQRPFRR
jgi:hypothetical protein